MTRHLRNILTHGIAVLLAFGMGAARAQEAPAILASSSASPVLAMNEAGAMLRLTVGYSKLLKGDQEFGTIIIGDDTIANTTIGAGNSIIVTGLAPGSTNLIVMNTAQELLMSTNITVVPVAGPLRATVTVLKGANMRERYECRGTSCTQIDALAQPTEMSFLLAPTPEAAKE